MPEAMKCNLYYEDSPNYLIEYRGNFKEEIDKVTYACGDIITKTIGVISTKSENLAKILIDVPSIKFIDPRCKFVLQDISPDSVGNINAIKINPYLDLTGKGVLVGMVDTGIDYLNEEFIREDDTSRILSIWDQTIQGNNDLSVYIGKVFSNEDINNAIKAYRNTQNPYEIVSSRDEIGHGTEMAGIIGARGYNREFKGIAEECEFVIVKLLESFNFKNELIENGVPYTPIYNTSEILAGIEYLKNYAIRVNKPMVIYLGLGTTEGAHDGNNMISRYLTSVNTIRGIVTVVGAGNEGASEGHASGVIKAVGDVATVELKIPKEIKSFSFNIWILKPNKASLNVVSPNGEASNFIKAKLNETESKEFVYFNTKMTVRYFVPEHFTGHEVISVVFKDIKPGIWTFQLRGDYITDGKFHIWLPPVKTLPESTKFLQSSPFITLTIPSTARKVATVSYYGNDNALVAASGKGFALRDIEICPDIATIGVNILTTKVSGGVKTVSGSSAATAIVAGSCVLLLQWGIINGNDKTIYSTKAITYLIDGADRSNPTYRFPNREIGYGFFDLLGTFNIISRSYREAINLYKDKEVNEYYVKKLFIRIPNNKMEKL